MDWLLERGFKLGRLGAFVYVRGLVDVVLDLWFYLYRRWCSGERVFAIEDSPQFGNLPSLARPHADNSPIHTISEPSLFSILAAVVKW